MTSSFSNASLSELIAFTYTALAEFPSSDADILISEILEVSHTDRVLYGERKEEQKKIDRLLDAIKQRKNHRSVSSILGYWWFFGRKFFVSDTVLTPRPETEVLVARVLSDVLSVYNGASDNSFSSIFDIGTGSGCIALTLCAELRKKNIDITVLAGDISLEACAIARQNAVQLGESIEIRTTDLFSGFEEKEFHNAFVVANLPYVPLQDKALLEPEVLEGDPHLALFSGKKGADLYTRFFEEIPEGVHTVYAEFHPPQASFLSEFIKKRFPYASIEFFDDLEHQTRFLKADLHFFDHGDSQKP